MLGDRRRSPHIPVRRIALCLAITTPGVAPCALSGQEDARAVRLNGSDPVIDGRLDETVWQSAPALRDLRQREPNEGAAVSESTEVRFLFNDRELFVGFRGYDSDPSRIVGRLVRRDQRIMSDYFNLFIDSYHDGRTAFEFAVNPSGARRDVFIFNDGGGRDESWDPVYDWATRVDSLGWTVELRIPFTQLRFQPRDSVVFGLRVRRAILRHREESSWPFFPRDMSGEVSYYGRLIGLVGLPRPRRVELLPYTSGSTAFQPAEVGNPFATGRRTLLRGGADLKVGLTSSLTLDLTANPDFGQVEADPAVVNLTAFESFFPEKRPFFVEGTNLFRFGLSASGPVRGPEGGGGGGGGGPGFGGFGDGLVYTRRVGRSPQIRPSIGGGYADVLNQTTILGAGKVTGQFAGGWAVGLMQAITAKEMVSIVDSAGVQGASPVEPLTSHTVVRALRNTKGGRLTYGVIGTGVVRDLEAPSTRESVQPCPRPGSLVPRTCVVATRVDSGVPAFDALRSRAFSGGGDFRLRFGRDRYDVEAGIMGSQVEGSAAAILATQRSAAHYYQRPDQTYAQLDSNATVLRGFGGYARVGKVTGFIVWDLRAATRSPGFEVNDLGFMRQADQHTGRASAELRWLRPGRVFRRFQWEFEQEADFSYGWERTRATSASRINMEFPNYWGLSLNAEREYPALNTRALRGGPALSEPGSLRLGGNLRTDFRKAINGNAGGNYTREDLSQVERVGGNAAIRFRPPGAVALSIEGRASREIDDRQYVTRSTIGDSTYYVMGRIDRREVSVTLRFDLALTPRLSLEVYGQPFLSTGRYSDFRLVRDGRAAAYADRFDPLAGDRLTRPGSGADLTVDLNRDGATDLRFGEPDFRVVSLRTNAVLRWEFLPGSTLFVVWQQNREEEVEDATLRLGSALGDALSAAGQHVVAVKVAYWTGL